MDNSCLVPIYVAFLATKPMAKATGITDIRGWPVMQAKCPTCPFNKNRDGKEQLPDLADKVRRRCLTQASQICHHPRLKGKKQNHLCMGARDFQLQVFHRLGVLDEPTDAAWDKKAEEMA